MEVKRIIFISLCAGLKNIEILKQLNVNIITVHRVEQRVKVSEFLNKDHLRSERLQVISQEVIKISFENDPCKKMTRLAQRRNVSVSTVFRMVKNMERKTRQRDNKKSSSLNHDAWRSTSERKYACGLFERGYRLTSALLQQIFWRQKIFHESRKLLKNQIMSSNKTERRHIQQRLCRTSWTPTRTIELKTFGTHSQQIWVSSISACERTLRKRLAKYTTTTQMSSMLL